MGNGNRIIVNMETTRLVGKTIACECGKTHRIDPREVLYAEDAVARFPALCAKYCAGRRVAVVFDARTREAAGDAIVRSLRGEGWTVHEVLVADPAEGTSPICDEATQKRVAADIGLADLIVSVGSGVISDLGKWTAFERNLPAIPFGTAASMNGYAAANVASAKDGVKIVVRARPPVAVASSPTVLRSAPQELTTSGLGDALAKGVSSADWRLNHVLFGDYYCARSVGLIADIEPLYLNNPRGVRDGGAKALEALFDALLLTGIAMTMAESSDPASGAEHLISHTLDMTAMARGTEHDLHGRQVGVCTILASELYRRVLDVESPRFGPPAGPVDRDYWGPIADACSRLYVQKAQRMEAAVRTLGQGDAWDRLRRELAPMLRPPMVLRDCLRQADGAYRAGDIGCSHERLTDALLHAHQMRGRVTVLDLAYRMGILPAAAGEIVEEWA